MVLYNRQVTGSCDWSVNFRELFECGIPQGSPISCTLFLLYIHDITNWVEDGELQGYADDTLHYVSSKDPSDVVSRLEVQAKRIFAFLLPMNWWLMRIRQHS